MKLPSADNNFEEHQLNSKVSFRLGTATTRAETWTESAENRFHAILASI